MAISMVWFVPLPGKRFDTVEVASIGGRSFDGLKRRNYRHVGFFPKRELLRQWHRYRVHRCGVKRSCPVQ